MKKKRGSRDFLNSENMIKYFLLIHIAQSILIKFQWPDVEKNPEERVKIEINS